MGNNNGCWGKLGRVAGNWHDLGKFSDAFQNYLKCSAGKGDNAHTSEIRGRVDHTSAGAQHAVESLPVTLLAPCLKAIQILVEQYGCTVVLCTATQPAIEYRPGEFEIGLPQALPIIPDAPKLYERLKRVEVKDAGVLDCTQLAEHRAASEQVLAIVSTRRHAGDWQSRRMPKNLEDASKVIGFMCQDFFDVRTVVSKSIWSRITWILSPRHRLLVGTADRETKQVETSGLDPERTYTDFL